MKQEVNCHGSYPKMYLAIQYLVKLFRDFVAGQTTRANLNEKWSNYDAEAQCPIPLYKKVVCFPKEWAVLKIDQLVCPWPFLNISLILYLLGKF